MTLRRGFLPSVSVLTTIALLAAAGCATVKPSARPETKGTAVRFPPAESPKVKLRTETPLTVQEGPPAEGDDYKYRWLRIIEVDVVPTAPPPGAEEPGPGALP
jgi:hypothetical protein